MMATSSKSTHIVQSSNLQGHRSDGTLVAIAELHRSLITQKLAGMLLEYLGQLEKIANLVGIFAQGERQLDFAKLETWASF